MGAIQPIHWIVVLVIVLIVFGPGKLPQLGQSVGRMIRDFRKSATESDDTVASLPREERCVSCDAVLTPEMKFCARCGAPRKADNEKAVAS